MTAESDEIHKLCLINSQISSCQQRRLIRFRKLVNEKGHGENFRLRYSNRNYRETFSNNKNWFSCSIFDIIFLYICKFIGKTKVELIGYIKFFLKRFRQMLASKKRGKFNSRKVHGIILKVRYWKSWYCIIIFSVYKICQLKKKLSSFYIQVNICTKNMLTDLFIQHLTNIFLYLTKQFYQLNLKDSKRFYALAIPTIRQSYPGLIFKRKSNVSDVERKIRSQITHVTFRARNSNFSLHYPQSGIKIGKKTKHAPIEGVNQRFPKWKQCL